MSDEEGLSDESAWLRGDMGFDVARLQPVLV